jgi:catechol 2,3-dioxygenase-like lactoylglutathione lyase family enzyme
MPRTFLPSPHTNALRIIHTGFVVNDRAAEDHFYKDVLGFHVYWHGGRHEGKDDWVAMQVPDGTDWVEYMLNIPPTANHHTFGVANHIALGVEDIQTEEPQIGLDGKWQLNVYDPDGTRTQFMEFKPVEKPCCSQFTGVQPGPE